MSLRLDGVSVDLAGRRIVSGISLTVGDGQFVGLLGPNGSGKSTILKAIYRVHRPSSGRLAGSLVMPGSVRSPHGL